MASLRQMKNLEQESIFQKSLVPRSMIYRAVQFYLTRSLIYVLLKLENQKEIVTNGSLDTVSENVLVGLLVYSCR